MGFWRAFPVAMLAFLFGFAVARGAEPAKIRIAWTTVPGQLTPVLFADKNLLVHAGASYVVEHYHVSGNTPMVTLLAADEVDLAPLAPSALGVAIQNAGLEDIRVVADDYQDGIGHFYSSDYLVRADSAITTIEDLKGKVLAVNNYDAEGDIALRLMLRRHGLSDRSDVSIVETPYPNMAAMLEGGKVDLAAMVAPFSQSLRDRGGARPLFAMKDALGPSQSLVLVARTGFLARNHDAVADFFEDYLRALHWFLAPRNRGDAIRLVAQFNKQSEAVFGYLFSNDDYYRDPNGRPNLEILQKNLRTLREVGFLNIDIGLDRYTDLGFIDEAAQRLKRAP
jgi:sulfonate transport system substrate-binding protein